MPHQFSGFMHPTCVHCGLVSEGTQMTIPAPLLEESCPAVDSLSDLPPPPEPKFDDEHGVDEDEQPHG